jgi:hypothetical protein
MRRALVEHGARVASTAILGRPGIPTLDALTRIKAGRRLYKLVDGVSALEASMVNVPRLALLSASVIALNCASASAQVATGIPGTPGATTTIDGKQLPPPDPKFGGVINQKASESKPWWAPRVVPPKGAPNVLLIMTDDAGFGAGHVWRRRSDTGAGSDRE